MITSLLIERFHKVLSWYKFSEFNISEYNSDKSSNLIHIGTISVLEVSINAIFKRADFPVPFSPVTICNFISDITSSYCKVL